MIRIKSSCQSDSGDLQDHSSETQLLSSADWARLRRWYSRHGRHDLPWRRARSPWAILLAETLLRRTRAEIAAKLYPQLLEDFPNPSRVVANAYQWKRKTKPLGLAWRSRMFVRTCEVLVKSHRGAVPTDEMTLQALPGVGHYVARAVRCFGFGLPATLVDTNTIRLASRISGASVDAARHRSQAVQRLVKGLGQTVREDNFALFDLAALVCRPRRPLCEACPLASVCATGRSRVDVAAVPSRSDNRSD
jgi:A/G-specific adenine glycosylase